MRQAYDYWQDQPGTYHRRRACARRAPPARVRAPTRARLTPGPQRFVGGHAASARSRRLQTPGRISPRLGGARLGPGWGPSCPCGVAPSGARLPAPGLRRPHWPDRVPTSFWFTRSERRLLHASSRGAPLGTVRLRTATRTKACDPSATASALPLGRPPPRKDTSMLRGGHCSPHAPGPSRRDGAPAPGYGRPTAGRRPGLGSVGVRSWRPGRPQRPCHHALCVLTRRGCPILYVPAQCAPAKTEALLPSRFREGRRDLLPSQNGRGGERPPPPPLPFSGGEERRARRPAGRARARGRDWARHTCGREGRRNAPEPLIPIQADTNPGCNYLVRGYSPSMHYFWRGDMPHFSSPLPFQRGRAECRRVLARDLGGPDRGRPRVPGCGSPPTPATIIILLCICMYIPMKHKH